MIVAIITALIITHAIAALIGLIIGTANRDHQKHIIQILREYIRNTLHEASQNNGQISQFTQDNGHRYHQATDPDQ